MNYFPDRCQSNWILQHQLVGWLLGFFCHFLPSCYAWCCKEKRNITAEECFRQQDARTHYAIFSLPNSVCMLFIPLVLLRSYKVLFSFSTVPLSFHIHGCVTGYAYSYSVIYIDLNGPILHLTSLQMPRTTSFIFHCSLQGTPQPVIRLHLTLFSDPNTSQYGFYNTVFYHVHVSTC